MGGFPHNKHLALGVMFWLHPMRPMMKMLITMTIRARRVLFQKVPLDTKCAWNHIWNHICFQLCDPLIPTPHPLSHPVLSYPQTLPFPSSLPSVTCLWFSCMEPDCALQMDIDVDTDTFTHTYNPLHRIHLCSLFHHRKRLQAKHTPGDSCNCPHCPRKPQLSDWLQRTKWSWTNSSTSTDLAA